MKNDLIAITLATLALIWLSSFGTLLEVTNKIKAMRRLVSFGVKFEFFDQHPRSLHIDATRTQGGKPKMPLSHDQ